MSGNSAACLTLLLAFQQQGLPASEISPLDANRKLPIPIPMFALERLAEEAKAASTQVWKESIRHLDPEEAARLRRPFQLERPIERDAILPIPVTGRELVDQFQAETRQVGSVPAFTTTGASAPRVFQRWRLAAPNFVLPVGRGD
jgi:hypothetical protein